MIQRTGEEAHERGMLYTYTLANQNGMRVTVNTVGCVIQSILAPDRDGNMTDVVLGHATAGAYAAKDRKYYFGCILGRCANRIKGGELVIDERTYQLTKKHRERSPARRIPRI